MKENTKGLINMYKTGTYKKTALALFYDYLNGVKHPLFKVLSKRVRVKPELIYDDEAEWLEDANHGP